MNHSGIWIEENERPKSTVFICSLCGGKVYDIQPTREKSWKKHCRYKYCPHCSAKME